jgi:hypothetical protein
MDLHVQIGDFKIIHFDSELPGKKIASPDGDELTHAGPHVKNSMLTFAPSCTHCNLHLFVFVSVWIYRVRKEP